MVEAALGLCQIVDEYVESLGDILGDPNSMSNRIEQSIRFFMESDKSQFWTFGQGVPPKNKKRQGRGLYSENVQRLADLLTPQSITISDILGPQQRRKTFKTLPPLKIAEPVDDSATDEEIPAEERICKQCESGLSVSKCVCAGCQAHHAFQRLLGSKRNLYWTDTIDKMEEFCTTKRRKMQQASKSASEEISSASPGGGPAGSSKGDVGGIPTSHPGASPSATPAQPKAKSAPRQPLSSAMFSKRSFETAEDGQTYQSKGPPNLVAFRYECEKALGNVFNDSGIQRVSTNQEERRYGPQDNTTENWCTLGRQKQQRSNRCVVVNCDHRMLVAMFSDTRFKQWVKPAYDGRDLNALSHFFAGFLRHYGCTPKGRLACDSGGWYIYDQVCRMLTYEYNPVSPKCRRAEDFHGMNHPEGGSMAIMILRSLIPSRSYEKTRYQVVVEVENESSRFIRPMAVRACSGQTLHKQLDPSRFAI
jgi:hypothetical protein